jgi:hypothetical protein
VAGGAFWEGIPSEAELAKPSTPAMKGQAGSQPVLAPGCGQAARNASLGIPSQNAPPTGQSGLTITGGSRYVLSQRMIEKFQANRLTTARGL